MLERIKELLRNEPFVPFRVILTSGNTSDVSSPYMLAIGETEASYYFPKSNKLAHLRLNQLAAVETVEADGV